MIEKKAFMKSLTFLFFINLLSCSTLDKETCARKDWLGQGHQDALNDKTIQFERYHSQCAELGINISKEKYVSGYEQGLKGYCTYQNGMKLGKTGDEPFSGCKHMSSNFYQGYEKGFKYFEEDQEEGRREDKKQEAIEDLLRRYGSKECSSDSDCEQKGDCSFNKCEEDGSACHFDSDCPKVRRNCKRESEYVSSIREWIEVRVCEE